MTNGIIGALPQPGLAIIRTLPRELDDGEDGVDTDSLQENTDSMVAAVAHTDNAPVAQPQAAIINADAGEDGDDTDSMVAAVAHTDNAPVAQPSPMIPEPATPLPPPTRMQPLFSQPIVLLVADPLLSSTVIPPPPVVDPLALPPALVISAPRMPVSVSERQANVAGPLLSSTAPAQQLPPILPRELYDWSHPPVPPSDIPNQD